MKALLAVALHLPIQACGAQSRWGWGLAGEGARGSGPGPPGQGGLAPLGTHTPLQALSVLRLLRYF